jgi:hypothetical protein
MHLFKALPKASLIELLCMALSSAKGCQHFHTLAQFNARECHHNPCSAHKKAANKQPASASPWIQGATTTIIATGQLLQYITKDHSCSAQAAPLRHIACATAQAILYVWDWLKS